MNLPGPKRRSPGLPARLSAGGFSLIEMLTAIAIIALLTALLLPALHSASSRAKTTLCLGNKRQLQLAWATYAGDYSDHLVPNGELVFDSPQTNRPFWWAQGRMSYSANHSDNTNVQLLLDPAYARLGEYTRNAGVYKCPADRSRAPQGRRLMERVRSVSMNVHVGRCVNCFEESPTHLGPITVTAIPNASSVFVFIDEHPDSLNTPSFWTSPARRDAAKFLSYPASHHDRGATLSFADGHVEWHAWREDSTRIPVTGRNDLAETESPNNRDVQWLQDHTYFSQEH